MATKKRGKARDLASDFIAEEMRTKKYPRKQAIAIGISRARAASKKATEDAKFKAILRKYRIS
jgi:hypothetical protein